MVFIHAIFLVCEASVPVLGLRSTGSVWSWDWQRVWV